MRIQLLAVVLVIASCSALFAGDRARPSSQPVALASAGGLAERLRAPAEPWTVDVRGGEAKLIDLVASFERASGERVTFGEAVRARLKSLPIGLTSNATVPPDQVYTWFESLVVREGFRVTIATHDEPRMLALLLPMQGADWPSAPYPVQPTDVALLDRHPALLVQTTVDVSPLDARQIANSLRALHPNALSLVVTPSESSAVVTGAGTEVAALVRVLEDLRKHEVARLQRNPPQPQQAAAAAQR